MQSFVELWVYLSATPLFGLTATLVTYVLAQALYARVGFAPIPLIGRDRTKHERGVRKNSSWTLRWLNVK